MLVLAVLRKLLAHGIPPPHMLPSAQGEHMPPQFVTASMCCALATTQFLVLPIYIYFPREAPGVPGDVQLTPPAFTLPQVKLLAAKVWGMTLAGLWEQCCQQSLVLCPTVSSPDWAGIPRSQGLQGRTKPMYFASLLCAEPSLSRRLHSSLWSSDWRGLQAGRGGTTQPMGMAGSAYTP